MKKLVYAVFLSTILVVLMCGVVFAEETFNAQGSAIAPCYIYRYNGNFHVYSSITISNITGETIKCKVTILNGDGENVTSMGGIYTDGPAGWKNIASGTGEFELPAHSTRVYVMDANTTGSAKLSILGQALIQWNSNDPNLRKALIAAHRITSGDVNKTSEAISAVNNGGPF